MKRALVLAVLFWPIAASTAWPIDQIYKSTSDKVVRGNIQSMSPTVVIVATSVGGPVEVATNEIKTILYENAPQSLLDAQKGIMRNDYEKAYDALKSETTDDKRPEVAQEIAFSRAFCLTQLMLTGDADLVDARQEMAAFLRNNPNSYHFYKSCEMLGDLYAAEGKLDLAQKCYAKLAQAPWPDCQIRAQVALGRASLAQGNTSAASRSFDEALLNLAPGDLAESQRTAARIGKARCVALDGDADRAVRNLNEIIDKLDDRNPDINATAYNALGTALRKAGKPDKAIFAFLRVHLKYNHQFDADAEAVANLERLFIETHQPNHSRDMRSILNDRYKNSRWAKGGVK